MTHAPSFDDIFKVMADASVGDAITRVAVPSHPCFDDTATKFGIALNILLDDLSLRVGAQGEAFTRLAASERRHRLIMESAHDGMFTLDSKGCFTDVNPAMCAFLGRPKSEVVGSISAFVAPDDRERARREFEQLIVQDSSRVLSHHFVRPDGSIVLADISASVADPVNGVMLGVLRDVTERDQTAQEIDTFRSLALVASEASSLASAFAAVLQGVCETNGWTVGAAWLPRFDQEVLECAQLLTRDPAERDRFAKLGLSVFARGEGVLGRAWDSKEPIWVRDLAANTDARSATAAMLGIHAVLIVPIVANDEVVAIVEFFMEHTAAKDDRSAAHVFAISAQLGPIVTRKRTEDALRASEARFKRLSDSGIVGIVTSNVEGAVLEANEAFLNMVGYSREELIEGSIGWVELTPPELAHLGIRAVEQLQASGVAPPWETETLRKDGTRVPTLMGVAMLDFPKCIAFVADLTVRKQAETALVKAENQLRQAQKMEAVGRLAGGVAHDFNNVLSVILSYSEIMLADLKVGDPMRDDVNEICKAGHRAADLTRQLLMFSRQQVIEPKVLDLNDVLRSMDKMLQRILGEDVTLVSVPMASLGRVRLDPSGLEQVILNLAVNARDAMPTGGRLTIETSNVLLDEDYARENGGMSAGPYVMLAVSDTGIGMDRPTQARIFEPFFTTKAIDKGTGLGLSTVYGIVQQSGGSIAVYSEPGKGTSFKVYLPRVDATLDVTRAEPLANAGGTETILLVEDEEQVRVVASSILRRRGYRVLEARLPSEAILLCKREVSVIDLLVTDVVMPEIGGPELAKRLIEIRPTMKVLCMSGYTDDSIVRHGVLQADIAYLQKPITPQTLTKKVRDVLDAPARAR